MPTCSQAAKLLCRSKQKARMCGHLLLLLYYWGEERWGCRSITLLHSSSCWNPPCQPSHSPFQRTFKIFPKKHCDAFFFKTSRDGSDHVSRGTRSSASLRPCEGSHGSWRGGWASHPATLSRRLR